MTLENFELSISYSQFGVFDASTEKPFNDWSHEHIAQGFSWRPESACFLVPFGDGSYAFEVLLAGDRPSRDEEAHRGILVPCPSLPTAELEIGSIGDSFKLRTPSVRDSVLVEFFTKRRNGSPLIRLTFYNEGASVFRIVKADSVEMANAQLLKTATPA